jgi:NADH-quinone oxidoreductase subunit N
MALTLGIGMFAMAGIPPFVGFTGKFMLLTAALRAGYLPLVILAALNTAISIYYYLSVVRVAYCGNSGEAPALSVDVVTKVVSVALLALIIALGISPNTLLEVATHAVRAIL